MAAKGTWRLRRDETEDLLVNSQHAKFERERFHCAYFILDGREKNLTAECALRYADIQGFWRDGSLGKILAIQA